MVYSHRLGLFSAAVFHTAIVLLTAICIHNCLTTHYRAMASTIYDFPGPWGWLVYVIGLALLGVVVGVALSVRDIRHASVNQPQRVSAWFGLVLNFLLLPMPILLLGLLSGIIGIDFD